MIPSPLRRRSFDRVRPFSAIAPDRRRRPQSDGDDGRRSTKPKVTIVVYDPGVEACE